MSYYTDRLGLDSDQNNCSDIHLIFERTYGTIVHEKAKRFQKIMIVKYNSPLRPTKKTNDCLNKTGFKNTHLINQSSCSIDLNQTKTNGVF